MSIKEKLESILAEIAKKTGKAVSLEQAQQMKESHYLDLEYASAYGGWRLVNVSVENGAHAGAFGGTGCEKRLKSKQMQEKLTNILEGINSAEDKPVKGIKSDVFISKNGMEWSVNTPALLKEIANNNGVSVLSKPLTIFGQILHQVGERASEINDPVLNHLMCKLAIYEIADGYSPNHDSKKVNAVREKALKHTNSKK